MNSKLVIVMLVQLICICAPYSRPASASDNEEDLEHLVGIGSDISGNGPNNKKTLRENVKRHALTSDRVHMRSLPDHSQSDLLRELQVNAEMDDADADELESAIKHQAH